MLGHFGSSATGGNAADGAAQRGGGNAAASSFRDTRDCLPKETSQDLYTALSRLQERSKQLVRCGDVVVKRSLEGVCEASKALRRRTSKYRAPGGGNANAVDLLLAREGYIVHDQQRRMQQVSATRSAAEATTGGGAPFTQGPPQDMDTFLAANRNDMIWQAIDGVHRNLVEKDRDATESYMEKMWERRRTELVESFNMAHIVKKRSQQQHHDPSSGGNDFGGAGALSPNPASPNPRHGGGGTLAHHHQGSKDVTPTMARLAKVVHHTPPGGWLDEFTNVIADDETASPDMVQVWTSAIRLLEPVADLVVRTNGGSALSPPAGETSRGGSQSPIHNASDHPSSVDPTVLLAAVSSSRAVFENRHESRVFQEALGAQMHQLEEFSSMHAMKFKDVITKYAGGIQTIRAHSPWVYIYLCMRSGRYDAAALFAQHNESVRSALSALADAQPHERNSVDMPSLQGLYQDDATTNDVHRRAVLLSLSRGNLGLPSEEVAVHVGMVRDLVVGLDDWIWFRLTLITNVTTTVAADSRASPVQSLFEFQKVLVAEQQRILTNPHSMEPVHILLGALLPSTAIRIMLDNEHQRVDAIHLALLFEAAGLLRASPMESPLELDRELQRYTTYLLGLRLPDPRMHSPLASIFHYFLRTNRIKAFVDLCVAESVCVRLFGRVDNGGREGELLRDGGYSADLLAAMETVARAAASRGHLRVAVHVLLVLETAANALHDTERAANAIKQCFKVLNPVLSQSVRSSLCDGREDVLALSRALQERLPRVRADAPARDVETFEYLNAIAEMYTLSEKGNHDAAIQAVLRLPFIPLVPDQIEQKANFFNTSVADDVCVAMPQVLLTVMGLIHALLSRKQSNADHRESLQLLSQSLYRWHYKWRFRTGQDVSQQLAHLQQITAAP